MSGVTVTTDTAGGGDVSLREARIIHAPSQYGGSAGEQRHRNARDVKRGVALPERRRVRRAVTLEHPRKDYLVKSACFVARKCGSCCGVSINDLIHEGWLAFMAADEAGESTLRAYRRAECRMQQYARRAWMPIAGSRSETRRCVVLSIEGTACDEVPVPVEERWIGRLTKGDRNALRTWLLRVLGPRRKDKTEDRLRLMIGLLLEGRSLWEMADQLGRSTDQIQWMRARSLQALYRALAATAGMVIP